MALQKTLSQNTGVDIISAYYKVNLIQLDYENKVGFVILAVYKDKQARTDNKEPIIKPMYQIIDTTNKGSFTDFFAVAKLSNQDPIKAAYGFLKSLPDFAVSQDV